jgi:hypothetical protein
VNKCETCKYWVRWEGSDCCQSAGLQKIAGPWGVLRPPADFGCRYHEVKPVQQCRNCYWFSATPVDLPDMLHPIVRHRCVKRTTLYEIILVAVDNRCDQWSERHD